MEFELAALPSVIVAMLLLFVGQALVIRLPPLRQCNIPVPVVGGPDCLVCCR